MMWQIDKMFELCYGHRVHSQVLDKPEYSINTMCKCRHLHGHQGTIKLGLCGTELENGMVTDFHNLNWLKKFIDDTIDHKFIIDRNDPLIGTLIPGFENMDLLKGCESYVVVDVGDIPDYDPALAELFESFVIVDFVPTSENLAKWIFDIAKEKMDKIGINVSYVDFWETPKSHCRYEG
jgi:6-pyruvoyltetrahydropterin/6-carboxytetrahydropterin synthase